MWSRQKLFSNLSLKANSSDILYLFFRLDGDEPQNSLEDLKRRNHNLHASFDTRRPISRAKANSPLSSSINVPRNVFASKKQQPFIKLNNEQENFLKS